MNIEVITEPFHYIKITGLYSKEERENMLEEMSKLQRMGCFKEPKETGQPTEEMKKNSGLFLWDIYSNTNESDILTHNTKLFDIFSSKETHKSWLFRYPPIFMSNRTLISYYENSDYYKPHVDYAQFTALTWFYRTPKKFKGGDFEFTEYNITHKVDNETTILFPSGIEHAATNTIMESVDEGKQVGRFCMAQFLVSAEEEDEQYN